MWRWYTAEDRRQAAALVLLLMVMGAVIVAAGPVLVGVALLRSATSTLESGPDLTRWPSIAWRLWRDPTDAGAAFGQAGALGLGFWVLAALSIVVLAVAIGWFAVQAYRMMARSAQASPVAPTSLRSCPSRLAADVRPSRARTSAGVYARASLTSRSASRSTRLQ